VKKISQNQPVDATTLAFPEHVTQVIGRLLIQTG
jgi:hypothetical protein